MKWLAGASTRIPISIELRPTWLILDRQRRSTSGSSTRRTRISSTAAVTTFAPAVVRRAWSTAVSAASRSSTSSSTPNRRFPGIRSFTTRKRLRRASSLESGRRRSREVSDGRMREV